jgi:hypothetical protein
MKDFYKEKLVKQKLKESDRKKKLWLIGGAIAISIFILQMSNTFARHNEELFNAFVLLALILIGVLVFFTIKLIKELNKEYEYAYTEDILDIDVIKKQVCAKKSFFGLYS